MRKATVYCSHASCHYWVASYLGEDAPRTRARAVRLGWYKSRVGRNGGMGGSGGDRYTCPSCRGWGAKSAIGEMYPLDRVHLALARDVPEGRTPCPGCIGPDGMRYVSPSPAEDVR